MPVFFKRVAEFLLEYDSCFAEDIFDIGCGNGILTCFLVRQHPDFHVTGLDLSKECPAEAWKRGREKRKTGPAGCGKVW